MTNRTDPAGKARPILAIETGTRSCSVAIVTRLQDTPVFNLVETDHGHATMLMPMIEQALKESGCAYGDLSRIAVAVGPGSFTGIRVGLAAALGLSLASGVPAVGISSLQAVGLLDVGPRQGRRFFALLDSRREEPFLAELDEDLGFLQPPAVVALDALQSVLAAARPLILAGDAPAIERFAGQEGIRLMKTAPNALSVAALASDPAHRFDLPPKPVYVRPPDVTMPKPK